MDLQCPIKAVTINQSILVSQLYIHTMCPEKPAVRPHKQIGILEWIVCHVKSTSRRVTVGVVGACVMY